MMINQDHNLHIQRMVLGPLATNCYFIGCHKSREAAIIDPAEESKMLYSQLEKDGFTLKYIINTHGHGDHIGGNSALKERYAASLLIHRLDAAMLTDPKKNLSFYSGQSVQSPPADDYLEEGQKIKIGSLEVMVLHTPGHSPGSISLIVGKKVFTGDTLFAGGIGRTDLPGGSSIQIMHSIREKLMPLEVSSEILPGHGPSSILQQEIENNPWLQS